MANHLRASQSERAKSTIHFVWYILRIIIESQVPRMAWRMISPLDLHESIPPDIPEPSPGKRRRSTSRKKSSKSESEHDVPVAEAVQELAEIEQG